MNKKISSIQRAQEYGANWCDGKIDIPVDSRDVAAIWLAGWAARGKADKEIARLRRDQTINLDDPHHKGQVFASTRIMQEIGDLDEQD